VSEAKMAMKNKDNVASITIRSVLSEVYAEEKASKGILTATAISRILRKEIIRRTDAAAKFAQASRLDLAEKENHEVKLLSKFLPPLLSEVDIDHTLTQVIKALPPDIDKRKCSGMVLKGFYSKVDRSAVDPTVVKRRTDELLIQLA